MKHIKGIGLENFRLLKDKVNFDLAPLTVLTGTNNSGKSTIINALKLLQGNFKGIPDEKELFRTIDNIFNAKIEVQGKLLERYGRLDHFISDGQDFVKFSFIQEIPFLQDDMEITITIKINDTALKDGSIVDCCLISKADNENILRVSNGKIVIDEKEKEIKINGVKVTLPSPRQNPRSKAHLVVNANLSYFYKKLRGRIEWIKSYDKGLADLTYAIAKYNEGNSDVDIISHLNKFNEKFNKKFSLQANQPDNLSLDFGNLIPTEPDDPHLGERIHLIDIIKPELNKNKGLYNLNFIKGKNKNSENFKNLLKDYYKEPVNKSLECFNEDILEFLSIVDWIPAGPNLFNDYLSCEDALSDKRNSSKGLSFHRFIKNFDLLSSDKNNIKYLNKEAKEFKNGFFQRVLLPFIEAFGGDQGTIPEVFETTESEKLMYKMIYDNIKSAFDLLKGLEDISCIPANRIIPKRVYSLDDDTSFSSLIKTLVSLDKHDRKEAYTFINKWLSEFKVADEFYLDFDNDTGFCKPYVKISGKQVLLADLGYGSMQILSVILCLLPNHLPESYHPDILAESDLDHKFIAIEEPESNLHPALQSKLADMFVDAIKQFDAQLLIETHSEYLIRKLQYLTAKKVIDQTFCQLYYFYHPDHIPPREEQVKKINIHKDGSLTDNFGSGFSDEAIIWKFELLKLSNNEQN